MKLFYLDNCQGYILQVFFFCFIYQQYCFNFPSHRNCTDLCCCFRHPCSVLEQSVSLCPDLHIGKLQTWIMVWYIANKLLQTGCDILLLTLHYLFYKSVHTRWSGGRIVLPLTPGTGTQRDVCKQRNLYSAQLLNYYWSPLLLVSSTNSPFTSAIKSFTFCQKNTCKHRDRLASGWMEKRAESK